MNYKNKLGLIIKLKKGTDGVAMILKGKKWEDEWNLDMSFVMNKLNSKMMFFIIINKNYVLLVRNVTHLLFNHLSKLYVHLIVSYRALIYNKVL